MWSRPFTLAGPYGDDLLAPQIAFSPAGDATVGFGVFSEQYPWISRGVITTRAASGKLSHPRPVPNAKQILSLAYDGSALELLTGASPPGVTCCGSAWGVKFSNGRFGRLQALVNGIQGATFGGLAGLPKNAHARRGRHGRRRVGEPVARSRPVPCEPRAHAGDHLAPGAVRRATETRSQRDRLDGDEQH